MPETATKTEEELALEQLDALHQEQEKQAAELAEKDAKEAQLRAALDEDELLKTVRAAREEARIKFHINTTELIKMLRSEKGFDVDAASQTIVIDGRRSDFETALSIFARRHENLREFTKEEWAAKHAPKKEVTKADLQTVTQKVAFIREHGRDAYLALSDTPTPSDAEIHKMSLAEFSKLPVRVKSQYISKYGSVEGKR